MLYRHPQKQEEPEELIHDDAFYKKHPKIMRLWLVDIMLTSGEVLQFYVSGMTQFDAYEKTDAYTHWVGNEKLRNKLKTFRLMP